MLKRHAFQNTNNGGQFSLFGEWFHSGIIDIGNRFGVTELKRA